MSVWSCTISPQCLFKFGIYSYIYSYCSRMNKYKICYKLWIFIKLILKSSLTKIQNPIIKLNKCTTHFDTNKPKLKQYYLIPSRYIIYAQVHTSYVEFFLVFDQISFKHDGLTRFCIVGKSTRQNWVQIGHLWTYHLSFLDIYVFCDILVTVMSRSWEID